MIEFEERFFYSFVVVVYFGHVLWCCVVVFPSTSTRPVTAAAQSANDRRGKSAMCFSPSLLCSALPRI